MCEAPTGLQRPLSPHMAAGTDPRCLLSAAEYLAKQGKSPPPQERTRDSGTEGGVSFDNDMSGWKPSDQPGSKHTMSGGFESTVRGPLARSAWSSHR